MRVTDQMIADSTLQNLEANAERVATVESQLTSGKRMTQISEHLQDGARALTIRAGIAQTAQYLRNADEAKAWLSATDTALRGVNDSLLRAGELATAGANDTLSASDRQGMAKEVTSIIGQVVEIGNRVYAGSYLFAGAQTTSAPFGDANGTATYANSDPVSATAPLEREIGPGVRIQINTVGHDPASGAALFDTVFKALTALQQRLNNNDVNGIKASITEIQNAEGQLAQEQATVGARENRVTLQSSQLEDLRTQLAASQSHLEDADMAQAAVDYAQADLVRRAGLSAAAKALPPSLFDYLA